jgi:hypothetical protein
MRNSDAFVKEVSIEQFGPQAPRHNARFDYFLDFFP